MAATWHVDRALSAKAEINSSKARSYLSEARLVGQLSLSHSARSSSLLCLFASSVCSLSSVHAASLLSRFAARSRAERARRVSCAAALGRATQLKFNSEPRDANEVLGSGELAPSLSLVGRRCLDACVPATKAGRRPSLHPGAWKSLTAYTPASKRSLSSSTEVLPGSSKGPSSGSPARSTHDTLTLSMAMS